MKFEDMKSDALKYLKESRRYVYFAALLFLFFVIVGVVFQSKLTFLDEVIRNLVSDVSLLKGFDVALYIFANNTQAALTGLITGMFLGLVPVLNLVANGAVVGYVFARVSQEVGFIEVWKILPHGIFELPAIFISLGLGIKLGLAIFTKKPFETLKQRLYYSMLVFLLIVVPLLLLAACIEGALIDLFE
jgi:stage II sporulation protein M